MYVSTPLASFTAAFRSDSQYPITLYIQILAPRGRTLLVFHTLPNPFHHAAEFSSAAKVQCNPEKEMKAAADHD